MQNRNILLALGGLILFAAFAGGVFSYISLQHERQDAAAGIPGLLWPNPKPIKPFTLADHTGQSFGLNDLKGHWSFMFFGFTHCPDICPLTLATLDQMQQMLAARNLAGDTRILFVTVDPGRDTPERLAEYVKYFNKDFIGLGGSPQQIADFTRQIGVVFQYGPERSPGDYQVDHSASVFLIDPEGRLVSIFPAPHQAEAMANQFKAIRRFIEQQA